MYRNSEKKHSSQHGRVMKREDCIVYMEQGFELQFSAEHSVCKVNETENKSVAKGVCNEGGSIDVIVIDCWSEWEREREC